MSSGEMGSSFKRHTHCAKRSVQGVTCLYFSIEGVFIAGKEIKEVLFSQIMYILKTCTLKMVVIRVSSECNYFKKQRIYKENFHDQWYPKQYSSLSWSNCNLPEGLD